MMLRVLLRRWMRSGIGRARTGSAGRVVFGLLLERLLLVLALSLCLATSQSPLSRKPALLGLRFLSPYDMPHRAGWLFGVLLTVASFGSVGASREALSDTSKIAKLAEMRIVFREDSSITLVLR